MNKLRLFPILALGLGILLAGCKAPVHLSYDFGRAYQATFPVQSDLTRESVMSLQHPLGGMEGVEIRLKVTKETTEKKEATTTLTSGSN
jgi:hypothetical protein